MLNMKEIFHHQLVDTLAYINIILVHIMSRYLVFDSRYRMLLQLTLLTSTLQLTVDPINKHLDSRSRAMFTPAALVLRNRLEDDVLMRIRNVLVMMKRMSGVGVSDH